MSFLEWLYSFVHGSSREPHWGGEISPGEWSQPKHSYRGEGVFSHYSLPVHSDHLKSELCGLSPEGLSVSIGINRSLLASFVLESQICLGWKRSLDRVQPWTHHLGHGISVEFRSGETLCGAGFTEPFGRSPTPASCCYSFKLHWCWGSPVTWCNLWVFIIGCDWRKLETKWLTRIASVSLAGCCLDAYFISTAGPRGCK